MILVTGATGHLGAATIDFLLKNNVPAGEIGALVRDKAKAAALTEKGIEVKTGDYTDPASLAEAFKGVDKLLLVSSSDMHDRAGQHKNAIDAAKAAGVKHLLYTSAPIKKETGSPMQLITQAHIDTEAYLKAAGIDYTILRNTLYADVLPMFFGPAVLETGIYLPAGDGKAPYATRLDMAEATANVLTTTGHENKTYNLNADTTYTFAEAAELLSSITGKTVGYHSPAPEEFKAALTQAGLPAEMIAITAGFAEAIKTGELESDSTDLSDLLKRKPTSLSDYFKTVYTNN
jgi:NAD(P)H dehydrogenase (quinone)